MHARLMQATSRKSFLVIGRAGLDLYPHPPGTRTEDATEFVAALGGSSANIAVALTRQGMKAALLTRVSDDAVGRFCLNQLDHYGVDRRHVRPIGGEFRNSLALAETRIENHQSVIYRNGAADFKMGTEDVEAVDYQGYGALITTGTVLAAEPSRSAAFHAFSLAQSAGVPMVFDVDYRPYSWPSAEVAAETYSRAAALCDIVVGNDEEFGFMAGGHEKGLAKARSLLSGRASIVIYKMGARGAITMTPAGDLVTGIYKTTTLKPTGAGDGFMGGFLAGLADGRPLRDCVLRGSATAAIVVSRVGCAPAMPTAAELDAFMAAQSEPLEHQG
jgi:5-dehydro-2-deoxygluconokinase